MYYLGIDLGGTNMPAGIVDGDGKIIEKLSVPTRAKDGPEAIIGDMAALYRGLLDKTGIADEKVLAIGSGLPGISGQEDGIAYNCPNIYWNDVPIRKMLGGLTGKKVYIANDAAVAGLAEAAAGSTKGMRHSAFITVGTGIGGGFVLNGEIFVGYHSIGAHIGHMPLVAKGGRVCGCGKVGCFEAMASASALKKMGEEYAAAHIGGSIFSAIDGDIDKIDGKVIFDMAKQGDSEAMEVYKEYLYYLARGIAGVINVFDPEIIALGGGVAKAGAFLIDDLNDEVPKLVHVPYKTRPIAKIVPAVLGDDAGIIGAAMMAKIELNKGIY